MPARPRRKPRLTIVGAGNLAAALAVPLHSASYRIDLILTRSNPSSLQRARRLAREVGAAVESLGQQTKIQAEVVWFCVPDGAIGTAARSVVNAAEWKGRIALHSSGALTSDELDVLRKSGAAVASVHPLMTFVRGSRPPFTHVPFAMEGDRKALAAARAIIKDLHGRAFSIRKQEKEAYHAWGMFASPLLTALLAATEDVAARAGVGRNSAVQRMLPILTQTLQNYSRLGASHSFSGPIARGDVDTVRKHLEVLQEIPEVRDVYLALARVALRDLPARNRVALGKLLKT